MIKEELKYYDIIQQSQPIVITESWWKDTLTHPYMNRLRFIHQTSSTNILYHSMNHSRYEHAANVGFMISKYLPRNLEHGLREKAIFSGICHDIGHGPFSHSLEKFILPKLGVTNWKHESMSEKLAMAVYNDIPDMPFDNKDFLSIVKNGGKHFKTEIFHLVSNKACGFDMDRMDYIKRDLFYSGMPCTFDWQHLIKGIVWFPDFNCKDFSLGFHKKHVKELKNMLDTRFSLFENVYNHPQVVSMNLLIADLIVQSESYLRVKEKIQSVETFITLQESMVLEMLAKTDLPPSINDVCKRLRFSKLYENCGCWEIEASSEKTKKSKTYKKAFEERFKKEIIDALDHIVRPEDIEISFFEINTLQDCDPSKILVYDDNNDVNYLSEPEAAEMGFVNKRKYYFMIFSKNEEKTDAIAAKMKIFAEKNPQAFVCI